MSGNDLTRDAMTEVVKMVGCENKDDNMDNIRSGVVRPRQRLLSLSVPRKFFQNIPIFSEVNGPSYAFTFTCCFD